MASSHTNLIDRIRLGFHFVTHMVDPDRNFLPYWGMPYDGKSTLRHGRIDNCDTPFCWMEIILINRRLTGTQDAPEVEEGLRKWCETNFHPDGLRYPDDNTGSGKAYCFLHGLAYVLDAMVSWYALTGEPHIKKRIDDMIAGLGRIAAPANLHADLGADAAARENAWTSALCFPFNNYVPGKVWDIGGYSTINAYELPGTGTFILPLARYYEMTGDRTARKLAAGLTEYMLNISHLYGYDGRFVGHFHRHLWSVAGILKYAELVGNEGHAANARRIYEFAEGLGSPFGWFPEMVWLKDPSEEYCETCCVYDMIHGALTLAQSGHDEYWDKASAYVKNHLMKNQFTHPSALPDRNMADRMVGGFTGWTQVNDYFTRDGKTYVCGCCTFHGIKALYYAWDAATERRGRNILVHLLFDKENDDVSVQTWLPEDGRIEVRLKRSRNLHLRIPPWAREDLTVEHNGQVVPAEWHGNYLRFKDMKPNDAVRVNFTVPESRQEMEVSGRRFVIHWRGDVVTRVAPEGQFLPLYRGGASGPVGADS